MPTPKHIEIVDWAAYQHYKNRNPPWVKFYTSLLDSDEWFNLSDASKLLMTSLFLIAARKDNKILTDPKYIKRMSGINGKICFEELLSIMNDDGNPRYIKGYGDASDMLAGCLQDAIPEKRRERGERETEESIPPKPPKGDCTKAQWLENFETFIKAYPAAKRNRGGAIKKWELLPRSKSLFTEIMAGLEKHKNCDQWAKDGGQFIVGAAVFIYQQRWLNDPEAKPEPKQRPLTQAETEMKRNGLRRDAEARMREWKKLLPGDEKFFEGVDLAEYEAMRLNPEKRR